MTSSKRFFSKLLVFSSLVIFSYPAFSKKTVSADDPYQKSFETYADEVIKLSPNSSYGQSIKSYADDVKKITQQAGYIGPLIPLPKPVKVTDGVYTVIGSQIWGNRANYGHNNNVTFIIFKDGVFVYNAGANAAIAYAVHHFIKEMTDKPVKWVAVENAQGHAYMGSSYWVDVGVKNLYSQENANKTWHKIFKGTKRRYMQRNGEIITATARDVSDKFTTFKDKMTIDVGGGETVELVNFGGGHTPTMTGAYVPSRKVLFTGDLGVNERIPGLFKGSSATKWLKSFDRMEKAVPKDVFVIPGHGTPSDLATIKHQTYGYICWLSKQVKAIIDQGGTLEDVTKIDQSTYKDRPVFDQLATKNAEHVYYDLLGKESSAEEGEP